jgi:hypothetical protein
VILVGRNEEKLKKVQEELKGTCFCEEFFSFRLQWKADSKAFGAT